MNATLDCPGDMEEFRDIPGYPGYQISNYGNVFSRKLKRVIEAPTDKDGYLRIGLWNSQIKKNFRVHRLVAIAFIPNPENKPEVNHKDGNRTNANVSNLEWNTDKENNNHKIHVLGYNGTKGIHMKPVVLEKDGIEYPFAGIREIHKFLKCSGKSWTRLVNGLKPDINGYKIKI